MNVVGSSLLIIFTLIGRDTLMDGLVMMPPPRPTPAPWHTFYTPIYLPPPALSPIFNPALSPFLISYITTNLFTKAHKRLGFVSVFMRTML